MNWDQARARLTGCFIAMPTLFRDGDLELNLPGMRRHARFLLEGGVRAGNGVLLVCGGAGDFPTLHPDERIRVAEAVLDEVGGEVGVVLGAQSTDQRDVVALAQAAARLGAVAVQVSPPFYHPPTDDDVYEFVEAVASSADVGIVLYTTYWKGYQPPLELIERLAELPQLIGLKWASPSMTTFEKGLRLFAKRLCVIDNNFPFVYSQDMITRVVGPGLIAGTNLARVPPGTPDASASLLALALFGGALFAVTFVAVRLRDVTA